jgi:hypothetical protein
VQKDCYVLQLRPDQNFNNTELFTGKMTDQNGGIGYSLIQIDVNSLPNTVSSVILSLKNSLYQRSDQAGFYSSGKLQAFKVNSNWDQTSTTWNNKPAYDAQFFSESPTFSTFSSEWVDIDITYLYNLWKSGTTNYGILLKTDGVDTAGYCNGSKEYNCRPGSFYSSDHENVSFRPMLLISP